MRNGPLWARKKNIVMAQNLLTVNRETIGITWLMTPNIAW